MQIASNNGELSWNYDNLEIIGRNATEIVDKIMTLSKKDITFQEEDVFMQILSNLEDLGTALHNFINQLVSILIILFSLLS